VLHSLLIENFAIVEKLSLNLNKGLTIISGETGAGKSILINALALILGERTDNTVIRQGCEMAYVEGVFTLTTTAKTWLKQQNIKKINGKCTIRRVMTNKGRSRAYLNEQPISIQNLRQFGEFLVDIHGQHAHQSLLKQEMQRQLLDDMAEDDSVFARLKQTYQAWKTLKNELDNLGGAAQDREARLTLLRYQVQELESLELSTGSIQKLKEEHRRLAHANQLLENCQCALNLLDADDNPSTLAYLSQANRELNEVLQHDEQLVDIIELLNSAIIQTQESISELQHYLQDLEIDPDRLQWLDERIAVLQDVARKHKIKMDDLPEYFEELMAQLDVLENYEKHAKTLENQVIKALVAYRECAENLHQQRLETAKILAENITTNMRRLGMPGGYLEIAVIADEEATPSAQGTDIIEFLVSTNPGHALRPLHKVASGGELSRISLSIQVIAAESSGVPTLFFDEVDVGIGGGTAEIVGQLLRQLGKQRQVLCITHLPQVACQGKHHLQVNKTISQSQQTTQTQIKSLNNQQRIQEIARMLGGIDITAQTLAHAKEMLKV